MLIDVLPYLGATPAEEARRVVARSHRLHALGLALGAVMVGTVLYRHAVPASVWVLLALHGLVWPHVVWLIERRSADPTADGKRLFLFDTAMGGAWIALMQFNLMPTVFLVTMYGITLIAIGGFKYLAHGAALLTLACGVATVANGLAFTPATGTPEMLASLPLMVVFPVTLGFIMFRLSQKVLQQNEQLRILGSTDSMSGLMNRRYWEDAVNAALTPHCRDGAVMLLIDIDRFKSINDEFGHTIGDEVIRRVGAVIRSSLRDSDLAGRYGGDEFGVVLWRADLPSAAKVAERIRADVASLSIDYAPHLRCTLSIGLADSPPRIVSARDWIEQADAALYRAKQAGRNRLAAA